MFCTLPMLAGPGTDTFNCDNLGIAAMDTKSGSWTGQTGAVYDYTGILNWWAVNLNTERNSIITVATPPEGCHIEKIYRESGLSDTFINVYVSDAPITADNLSSATIAGTIAAESSFTVNGEYPYFALTPQGEAYGDRFDFTWAENGGGGGDEPSDGDHVTAANLKAQNPDGNFSASAYDDHASVNATMTYNGQSGAVYAFTDLISNGSWWTLDWDYPSPAGRMYTTTSGGYITSIQFDMDWTPSQIQFYVSEDPIDPESPWNGNAKQVTLNRDGDKLPVWTADALYKHFCLTTAQERVNDLTIVWSAEAPQVPCKTPTINCSAWDRITPGTQVTVTNQTQGATMHVSVYLNDVLDSELSKETTEDYNFALPGNAGDKVKVEAYATKEGYTDSETVSQTYELVLPQVGYVNVNPSWSLVPGMELEISTDTEGATIDYSYTIYKGRDDNWQYVDPVVESGALSGASPVKVTIPEENVTAGMYFVLKATGKCEGYADSDETVVEQELQSNVLPAPTFDPESGAELQAGKAVTMSKQGNAKELHYTVNGGEEQVTEELSVTFTVTEPLTIVAWQTGEAPYKDSEKVTATYTVEVLGDNIDAIYPAMFTDQLSASSYTEYEPVKSEKTGISYTYAGGMWPSNETDCFYLYPESESGIYSILYSSDNAKGRAIKRIKMESPNSWSAFYVLFSQDAPDTDISLEAEVNNYDYDGPRLRVNAEGSEFKFGEWIDLTSLDPYDYGEGFQDAKYFTIWRFAQTCYLSRVLVEYEDDSSEIEAIDTENATEAIYDLNGMKVNDLRNATPGVYIRIVDGKARKVMVK